MISCCYCCCCCWFHTGTCHGARVLITLGCEHVHLDCCSGDVLLGDEATGDAVTHQKGGEAPQGVLSKEAKQRREGGRMEVPLLLSISSSCPCCCCCRESGKCRKGWVLILHDVLHITAEQAEVLPPCTHMPAGAPIVEFNRRKTV